MLLRSNHRDGDLTAWFRDDIFIRKGGEAGCDDLHPNSAAGGDNVDRCLALGIRLDLQIAFVLTVENGIETTAAFGIGLPLNFFKTVTSMCEVAGGALYLRPRLAFVLS